MKGVLDVVSAGDLCPLFFGALILLVVGSRVCDESHRRWGAGLGVLAFLAYGCFALRTSCPASAEALLDVIVRGLVAGGMTMGLAWTASPLVAALAGRVVAPAIARVQSWAREARLRREGREKNRAEEERRRDEEARRAREAEREGGAREEREARRAEERLRRHKARWPCEKFFRLHAQELGERLGQQAFDGHMARYLGEDLPVESVEANAEEFLDLMRQHLGRSGASASGATLESLAQELEEKRRKILALPMDPKAKTVLIIDLENRYEELIKKAITEG